MIITFKNYLPTYIRFLRTLGHRLIWVIRFLLGCFVDQRGWRHCDALSRGLEPVLVGSVLYHPHLSGFVHITVLALDFTGGQLGLDFEGTIGTLVAISVGAIFIVPKRRKEHFSFD